MAQDQGGIQGWVVEVVETLGEPGVGLLIALESVFPPVPSEVVLPFAGFGAAGGDLHAVGVWAAATAGALVGAYALYAVGALVGYERVHVLAGKPWFLLFSQDDLARGERFFDEHGGKVVLFGRFVPLLRSVVSVPAGAARMPLGRFTLLTALGSGIWNALFIYVGYELGSEWDQVQRWLGPAGGLVVVAGLLALAWLCARKIKQRA